MQKKQIISLKPFYDEFQMTNMEGLHWTGRA